MVESIVHPSHQLILQVVRCELSNEKILTLQKNYLFWPFVVIFSVIRSISISILPILTHPIQKQSSGSVLQKNCSYKFHKIHKIRLCQSLKTCNFIKKETLAQVFSSEFCEISKNNFFYRTPTIAASTNIQHFYRKLQYIICVT